MNAIVKQDSNQSLISVMAGKAHMDPVQFARTVRSTVMPQKHTDEQFAALMMVAHEYGLNPIVKEIYAFPARGGGIVPIVSIDGWVNLVNSHPQCDGFTFEMDHDDSGKLVSCTCTMHRKDRKMPVQVTEYLTECKRSTDPWNMEHRMLRHKSLIQCARYAFGFSGIFDDDEGQIIAQSKGDEEHQTPPPPPPTDETVIEPEDQVEVDTKPDTVDDILEEFEGWMDNCKNIDDVETAWSQFEHHQETLVEDDAAILRGLYEQAVATHTSDTNTQKDADNSDLTVNEPSNGPEADQESAGSGVAPQPLSDDDSALSDNQDDPLVKLGRDLHNCIAGAGNTSAVAIYEQMKMVIDKFDKNQPEDVLDHARNIFKDFVEANKNPNNGKALTSVLAKWAGALDVEVGAFS